MANRKDIEARLEAATDGPWCVDDDGDISQDYGERWTIAGPFYPLPDDEGLPMEEHRANARLIAHAPTDLRRLLVENRCLREDLNRVQADANQCGRLVEELTRERDQIAQVSHADELIARAEAAEAAVERLRGALDHIAFKPLTDDPEADHATCIAEAVRIARAALSPEAREGT